MPTGKIDAFELISVIKKHINKLDELIELKKLRVTNFNMETKEQNKISSNTLLPAGRLMKRILPVLANRQGKFTAVDIAEEIGYPLDKSAYYPTCPNVRVALTKLCKSGLLYQWIIGEGMSASAISNTPNYTVNYLRRDSNLAKTLTEHPNRELVGYRIR